MSDLAGARAEGGRGRTALMLGVASLMLYIGVGFTMGGIFWALGSLVGLGAVALGLAARRQGGGHETTVAIILGGVPVLWTAVFLTVAALS